MDKITQVSCISGKIVWYVSAQQLVDFLARVRHYNCQPSNCNVYVKNLFLKCSLLDAYNL